MFRMARANVNPDRWEQVSDLVSEALGLSAANAQDRVGAMTQEEINQVAGKIDTLPAGASDEAAWIVGAIVIGFIIWYIWYRK